VTSPLTAAVILAASCPARLSAPPSSLRGSEAAINLAVLLSCDTSRLLNKMESTCRKDGPLTRHFRLFHIQLLQDYMDGKIEDIATKGKELFEFHNSYRASNI
jgi:hypothetical protein